MARVGAIMTIETDEEKEIVEKCTSSSHLLASSSA
jgi:hypothetical protein